MASLEVDLGADLEQGLKSLAVRSYGSDGDSAMGRLVEVALVMRLLWLNLMEEVGNEVEEPVLDWRFESHGAGGQTADEVRKWLFGRG